MSNETVKSIRRIVRGMEADPEGLGDPPDYKSIGTSRGIGYVNARGDVSGGGSEGGGDKEEQPGNDGGSGDAAGDENDTGGNGGTNDGSTPGGATDGDVKDVYDALTPGAQHGTATGTDPATGNITSLNINTLEGIEYVPPDGWESPDSEEGFATTVEGPQSCATFACPSSNDPGDRGATVWDSESGYAYTIGYFIIGGISMPPAGYEGLENCVSCPVDSNGSYRPELARSLVTYSEPPPISSGDWPSDGTCQVVWDEAAGGYKGHESDTDCSAAQKTASPFVIIRSQTDDTKYYRYTRLADGTTKIVIVDSGGTPVPGTIIKVVDESGKPIGFYDVSLDTTLI